MYIEWKLCSYVIKYVAFFSYIATKFSFNTPYRNLTICLIIFRHWRIFREPYFIKILPFYSSMMWLTLRVVNWWAAFVWICIEEKACDPIPCSNRFHRHFLNKKNTFVEVTKFQWDISFPSFTFKKVNVNCP